MKNRLFRKNDRFYLNYRDPLTVAIEISPGGGSEELLYGDTIVEDLKFRAINHPRAVEMIRHMQRRVDGE